MANTSVSFQEKDRSKTTGALPIPAGGIGVYSGQGRTDKAALCRSEDDIRRNYGAPASSMSLGGGVTDYNRGLQNAFAFVKAGSPVYIMRAIPTDAAPVEANVRVHSDGTDADANAALVTALGHGTYYNGLSIVVAGIEKVSRKITLVSGSAVSLVDNILPGTLKITDGTDTDYDGPTGSGGVEYGFNAANVTLSGITATGNITLTYEDATESDYSTLNAITGVVCNIEYERTTTQKVVRWYVVDDGETDPKNNYYETFLVSYLAAGIDEAGNGIFIEDKINNDSEIFNVLMGASYDDTKLAVGTDPYSATAYSNMRGLASGTAGTYAASDTDIIAAYGEFAKKADYDINRLYDAGYADGVKTYMGSLSSTRKFIHAYVDPQMSLFIESGNKLIANLVDSTLLDDLTDWRMGLGNMEFASLTGTTWGKITDTFNGGRKLWMPPSYKTCQNAITVHNEQGSWKSVMGPRRGVLDFEELAINFYDYVDELKAKQCNPLIIDERGIQMFYGNKTLKLTASAMQQSHARITRSDMSRELYFIALDFVAEDIITSTFNDLADLFDEKVLEYDEGLESYALTVGPPATSTADINNAIFRIKLALIFNQIAEKIIIETTVFRNGETLDVDIA